MTRELVHTIRSTVRKHAGAHRTAQVEGSDTPVDFGMHGGILAFYKNKYGVEVDRERPATLDYVVASVAG